MSPEDVLTQAEKALSDGDPETAYEQLALYAEMRQQGRSVASDADTRWEFLTETAIEMSAL